MSGSGSFYRQVNITTKGDFGLVAPNLDVVSQVDGQTYSFPSGRMIVYNPRTNKTLDVAGIATADKVRWGVGHNPKGGRIASEIRHIGGRDIDLCKTMLGIKVTRPQCPLQQVIDIEFGCTFTGSDYMLHLDIDDHIARSYYKEGAIGSLQYNLRTDLQTCTSCSEAENADKLSCQLADKINNDYLRHYPNTSKLGMYVGKSQHGLFATKKYANIVNLVLAASAVESTCGSGCAVKGLKSFSASGLDTITFINAVDPDAPTQTLLEQIGTVIDQINAGLTGKGRAYLKLLDDCCSYSIEVNTCLTGVTLTYHDDATTTGTTTAAFSSFTPTEPCVGCEETDPVTLPAGVRVYVDTVLLPCHCDYPDGNPPSYFGREVRPTFYGESWVNTSHRWVEVQRMKVPAGTGYEVQQQEFNQSTGGQGFDYSNGVDYTEGRIQRPADYTRAGAASVAVCDKLYCIWSIVTQDHFAPQNISRNVHNAQTLSFLNIPRTDTTTIEVAQEVIDALTARGFCSSADAICVSFTS